MRRLLALILAFSLVAPVALAAERISDTEWRSFWAHRLVLLRQERGTVEAPGVTTTTTTTLPAPAPMRESIDTKAAVSINPAPTLIPSPYSQVPRHKVRGLIWISDRTMALCPTIAPFFDPWDLEHALLVVECESNGDPYANDHWQKDGRSRFPLGIWSHMSDLYKARSLKYFGHIIDPYDVRQSSALAARLVYEPGEQGWDAWASCHRKDSYAIQRTLDR